MSQRKKQTYSRTVSSGGPRPSGDPFKERRSVPRGRDENRRRITFGIVIVGVLIATWVLMMSLGTGAGGSSPTPAQGQKGVDTKALDSAIATLQQRLQVAPDDVGAMIQLGNSYYDAERYGEAIPWYEKALESVPANTDVRTDLGTSYFYSGNLDKAKEHWFKVLEQDPNKVQTHYNLAVLYSHQTPPDTDSAVKEWETVIKIAPNSDQAKSAEKRLKDLGKR